MIFPIFRIILLQVLICWGFAVISQQNAEYVLQPDSFPGHSGTIKGLVTDIESGESLPFVHVLIRGSKTGVATNKQGYFTIPDLPPGVYTILASYIGYNEELVTNVPVEAGKETVLTIRLSPTFLITDEVIITASRKTQSVKLAPASIGLVTQKQLQAKNILSFDQAFGDIPGIHVTRSSGANVQAFSIRGASEVAGGGIGNRVLLLVDGRPALSPESGGALWNLVPLNSIERIEVVKGAYSSLFGSSAMGGVVNVITKIPSNQPETRVHFGYGFYNKAPSYTGYSKFNDFYHAKISHSRTIKRLSLLFDTGYKNNDGHKENASFSQFNFYGKAKYNLAGNRNIQLSANFNRILNDSPATWLSTKKAYTVAEHKKDDIQDRREYNADIHYYALTKSNLKYSSRFYYYLNSSLFLFNSDPGNDSTNVNTGRQFVDEESVRAGRIGNITQVDLFLSSKHYLIAGIDSKFDKIVGLPDSILYGTHSAISFGAYVQDEYSISERFIITGGIRYDLYSIAGDYSEANISPKIALVYKVNENFSIRSLFAQAFRDPSISERYIKFAQGSGLRFKPNPSLRSERLDISSELGAKLRLYPGISLDLALFYNKYKNLISFRQVSPPGQELVFEVINLKRALMQGMEISVKMEKKKFFDLVLGYTFLDAQDISSDRYNNNLAYKIKHSFSFSGNAYYKQFSLNFNGRYHDDVKEVFLYPGDEPEAYFLINTRLSYLINENTSLYFALNNITDSQYEELERYRMPGRSFSTGLMAKF